MLLLNFRVYDFTLNPGLWGRMAVWTFCVNMLYYIFHEVFTHQIIWAEGWWPFSHSQHSPIPIWQCFTLPSFLLKGQWESSIHFDLSCLPGGVGAFVSHDIFFFASLLRSLKQITLIWEFSFQIGLIIFRLIPRPHLGIWYLNNSS